MKMRYILAALSLFVSIILAWWSMLLLGIVSPAAIAYPHEVVAAFPPLIIDHLVDILATIIAAFVAFAVGAPIGAVLGFIIFNGRSVRPSMFLLLDFLRSIPATSLVPVFIILFGIGNSAKIGVGAFSCILVVALSMFYGLKNRNSTRLEVAKVLHLTPYERFLYVDVPESLPQLFLGFRTGISLSLILVVVSEMLVGGTHGLGRVIADTGNTDERGLMFAAIGMTGIIGYVFNYAVAWIEKFVIHWQAK
jgi:NitT/TauT family transport system permease protein